MTDRDRLIELFKKIEYKPFPDSATKYNLSHQFTDYALESIIDCIIASGVIVLPCKVGDTVYMLDIYVCDKKCNDCEFYSPPWPGDPACCDKTVYGTRVAECIEIKEIIATKHDIYYWLYAECFGKTVFVTSEEAEKALKERSGNNENK